MKSWNVYRKKWNSANEYATAIIAAQTNSGRTELEADKKTLHNPLIEISTTILPS